MHQSESRVVPFYRSFYQILTIFIRGIGAGIAVLLAKRGANVVVSYVTPSSASRAEDTAKAIKAAGTKAVIVQADVSDVSQHKKIVDAALSLSETGKIDILIHK